MIHLEASVSLLSKMSHAHQDLKIILGPLTRCMLFLQSIAKSKDINEKNHFAVSRSILISCTIMTECQHIERIQELTSQDMK